MKWISVKDRLPENDDNVIVYNPRDGIHAGYYDIDEVHSYIESDGSTTYSNTGWVTYYEWAPHMSPTHWMPLPEFPVSYPEKPDNSN